MDDRQPQISDAVMQAVEAGRKIEAVKLLREETGLGLKQAKHEIDRLSRSLHTGMTGPAAMQEEGGAGALIKIAVLLLVVLAAYLYFFAD